MVSSRIVGQIALARECATVPFCVGKHVLLHVKIHGLQQPTPLHAGVVVSVEIDQFCRSSHLSEACYGSEGLAFGQPIAEFGYDQVKAAGGAVGSQNIANQPLMNNHTQMAPEVRSV